MTPASRPGGTVAGASCTQFGCAAAIPHRRIAPTIPFIHGKYGKRGRISQEICEPIRTAGTPCYDQTIESAWKDNLRVVMVATRNPLNIGAAARAMANFGFSRLRVVNAYDVAFREARSAVGAAPLLAKAEEFASVADAVADCKL